MMSGRGRPRAGQDSLSREEILATALRLVDENGMVSLSMRRLAQALGVDAMAIYHYLPSKQAVIGGIVEMAFRELRLPALENMTWQERIRAFTHAYLDLTRRHRHLVRHLVCDAEAGADAALMATEHLYQALERSGLSARMILTAADLIVDYINGFALADDSGRLGQPGERQPLIDRLRQAPHSHPVMHRTLTGLAEKDTRADLDGGLNIILVGIETIAASEHATTAYDEC